jgi:hypothetical protein
VRRAAAIGAVKAASPLHSGKSQHDRASAVLTKEENMKRQILSLVGVLSLMLVAGSALAQNTVEANVPFNFTVNRTTLPAGEYRLSTVGVDKTLLIQSKDSKSVKLAMANHAQLAAPSQTTKLVFRCYGGDQCFLYQIWVQGMSRGREFPKSSAESEIETRLRSRDIPIIASAR